MNSGFFKYFLTILTCVALVCMSFPSAAQNKRSEQHRTPAVRFVPDSVAERMKNERDFLYANDPAFWDKEELEENSAFVKLMESVGRSPFLKFLLYIFLGTIIIFAVYQVMIVNNFFILSRSANRKKADHGTGEELLPANIDEKINNAAVNKEYRLAIRFLYLKTLQLLHDKKSIRLHAKSTNQDYIRQMQKHSGIGQFRLLTRIYEYVWYGEFQPSEYQFEIIRTNFDKFISQD